MPTNESKMSPYQQARAEAVRTAKDVLSASALFGKGAPPEGRTVEDLLKVAEWVLGDDRPVEREYGVLEIPPSLVPTFLDKIATIVPDCGHDDCAIHGPARAAKDVTPEDLVGHKVQATIKDEDIDLPLPTLNDWAAVTERRGNQDPIPLPPALDFELGEKLAHQGTRYVNAIGPAGRYWHPLGPDAPITPEPEDDNDSDENPKF